MSRASVRAATTVLSATARAAAAPSPGGPSSSVSASWTSCWARPACWTASTPRLRARKRSTLSCTRRLIPTRSASRSRTPADDSPSSACRCRTVVRRSSASSARSSRPEPAARAPSSASRLACRPSSPICRSSCRRDAFTSATARRIFISSASWRRYQ
ncbi:MULTISPECIES: hypothetical protein [Streptomyces]|uniref:Secreted protein n=2 Tax=Streptomyces rimosus TaxID=1927 RepID=A0A8A1UGZ6_STRR1|nr:MULTISPECIES: hypothetical protein [Streptomyces]MYT43608.1 hypothetical protein [Streptomyces sp. SID5471]QGY66156.1 hypothetical protein V519_009795 [Streptomyces rimosus R6-500]QST79259.1 hypothetical protein SRIM_002905 [Streptomyces rimosus subsp. rimosus ATCC 10970]QTL90845.1 hypothetical protein FMM49_38625 [Streptomyces rimosus subsp. rimosus]